MNRFPGGGLIVLLVSTLWPAAARAEPLTMGWPQPGGRGTPVVLTYSYSNLFDGSFLLLSRAELRAATGEGLALWSRYAPIDFREVPDAGPEPSDIAYDAAGYPQIRIGHHPMLDIAHAFFPDEPSGLAADIHFDPGIPWTLGNGRFDFLEAFVHELGHALGLQHETERIAMMNASYPQHRYSGLGTAFLFPADIENIQALYGSGAGTLSAISPTPEPRSIALVATGLGSLILAAVVQHRRTARRALVQQPELPAVRGHRRVRGRRSLQSFPYEQARRRRVRVRK